LWQETDGKVGPSMLGWLGLKMGDFFQSWKRQKSVGDSLGELIHIRLQLTARQIGF
jgi:hypothetical protein